MTGIIDFGIFWVGKFGECVLFLSGGGGGGGGGVA